MIIQHNISAMTTNNNLNISDKNISKSSEKLSTGYRINRAADDASGLTISEKLRGQVIGLNRAEKNIEEGVSLIETADGGMEEIEAILHRQRELSVQAANDTNTLSDREAIQTEIDMLNDEIDRITDETEYNTIKVLQGGRFTGKHKEIKEGDLSNIIIRTNNVGLSNQTNGPYMDQAYRIVYEYEYIQDLVNPANDIIIETESFFTKDPTTNKYDKPSKSSNKNTYYPADPKYNEYKELINNQGSNNKYSKTEEYYAAVLDFSNAKVSDLINKKNIQGFYTTCCSCQQKYSIKFVNKNNGQPIQAFPFEDETQNGKTRYHYIINVDLSGVKKYADEKNITEGESIVDAIMNTVKELTTDDKGDLGSEIHYVRFKKDELREDENGNKLARLIIYDNRDLEKLKKDDNPDHNKKEGLFGPGVSHTVGIYEGQAPLYIQEGANSGQLVKIDLPNTSTKMLGTRENVDVLSSDNATKTIQTFDNAIDYISRKRTELAAKQNSLEYRADYNTNASINQQAAESLIRDTNMADEMVNYSKSSILQQASQSMLAQANQVPQNVISLLQGT